MRQTDKNEWSSIFLLKKCLLTSVFLWKKKCQKYNEERDKYFKLITPKIILEVFQAYGVLLLLVAGLLPACSSGEILGLDCFSWYFFASSQMVIVQQEFSVCTRWNLFDTVSCFPLKLWFTELISQPQWFLSPSGFDNCLTSSFTQKNANQAWLVTEMRVTRAYQLSMVIRWSKCQEGRYKKIVSFNGEKKGAVSYAGSA